MESVVTSARWIERILAEQVDPEKELQIQKQIRLLQEGLEDVRRLSNRWPFPQLAQPLSRLLPLPFNHLLPLATPTRIPLRKTLILVHCADHGAGHLHHASSVEKRGTSPPTAQPSSASYISQHQFGC